MDSGEILCYGMFAKIYVFLSRTVQPSVQPPYFFLGGGGGCLFTRSDAMWLLCVAEFSGIERIKSIRALTYDEFKEVLRRVVPVMCRQSLRTVFSNVFTRCEAFLIDLLHTQYIQDVQR